MQLFASIHHICEIFLVKINGSRVLRSHTFNTGWQCWSVFIETIDLPCLTENLHCSVAEKSPNVFCTLWTYFFPKKAEIRHISHCSSTFVLSDSRAGLTNIKKTTGGSLTVAVHTALCMSISSEFSIGNRWNFVNASVIFISCLDSQQSALLVGRVWFLTNLRWKCPWKCDPFLETLFWCPYTNMRQEGKNAPFKEAYSCSAKRKNQVKDNLLFC